MNGSPRKAQKAPRLQPKTREMNAPTRQALKAPNLFRQRTLLHHLWCRLRKMKSTTWGSATPRAARAQRKYPISRGNRNGSLCRHASLFLSGRAVHSERIASWAAPGCSFPVACGACQRVQKNNPPVRGRSHLPGRECAIRAANHSERIEGEIRIFDCEKSSGVGIVAQKSNADGRDAPRAGQTLRSTRSLSE
jgi:hypothetical protein